VQQRRSWRAPGHGKIHVHATELNHCRGSRPSRLLLLDTVIRLVFEQGVERAALN
jgi:hypothetical protein